MTNAPESIENGHLQRGFGPPPPFPIDVQRFGLHFLRLIEVTAQKLSKLRQEKQYLYFGHHAPCTPGPFSL